jgi:hypothetical protein
MVERHHQQREIHDPHLEEHETAPLVTCPQGVQVTGQTGAYEATDVNIAALVPWVIALGVSVALVMLLTGGAFVALEYRERMRHQVPSPLFQGQTVHPEPRLLPNPVDSPPEAGVPPMGPVEYGARYRELEEADLVRLGLFNPESRTADIPPMIMERVTTAPDSALTHPDVHRVDGLTLPMPSVSSGGTRLENRLR